MAPSDDAEFSVFVQRRSRFVFRVAYAVLRNSYDAEDVVQEVFLKLYRNDAWRKMRDEQAFLARTTWRLAVDRLPDRAVIGERHANEEAELPSSDPNPEESAVATDWQSRVHRLIDALPEELRQPLALSTIEALSSSEISVILGIPEGTVRTRVLRARQLLREKLAALEGKNHATRHA